MPQMKRLIVYNTLWVVIFFLQWLVRNYAQLEVPSRVRIAMLVLLFTGCYAISAFSLRHQHHRDAFFLAIPWALAWTLGGYFLSVAILIAIFAFPIG